MNNHLAGHWPSVAAILVLAAVLGVGTLPGHVFAADSGASAGSRADAEEVKREWKEAMKVLKSYSVAQKDEALAKGRQALDAIDTRIQKLEVRAESEWGGLSRSARQSRREALHALRKQRNAVAEWYGSMKQSSASAWDDVRTGFVKAYGDLASSFEKAAGEFGSGSDSKK